MTEMKDPEKGSGIEDFMRDSEAMAMNRDHEEMHKSIMASGHPLDAGESLRLATIVGGYRYKSIQSKHIMPELGNPAIVLLLAYILTLPGIILEFFMLKSFWYYGFELYSTYVFLLATGCVFVGFYMMFNETKGDAPRISFGNPVLFAGASLTTAVSLTLLLFFGRGSAEWAILLSVIIVIALVLLLASSPRIEGREIFPVASYGAGLVIAALVPVHQAFGLWGGGGGVLEFTLLDGALVVIGVSIAFISLNSVRSQIGLFSCWLLGATIVALVAFHEFAAIKPSGSFEIYDQTLALEGAVFSIIPLSLYFAKELESARLWTHLLNSTRLLERKSYENALIEIEKAMELLSRSGSSMKLSLPWSIYGDIYYAMGKMNRAKTCYEVALQISPDNVETWLNMGNMLAVKGYVDQALASFQKAADIAPGDPKIWNNIGVVLLTKKRYDDALIALDRAIKTDDSFPMPYFNAAMILLRSGKPAAAMEMLDRLIALAPGDESFRKAHDKGRIILNYFQQAAGWKLLGVDVSGLVKILIQEPSKFSTEYGNFLAGTAATLSPTAFENDRELAKEAMLSILGRLGSSGEGALKLRVDSGLTPDQLRYGVAVLILNKKARFHAVSNEIRLIQIRDRSDQAGDKRMEPASRQLSDSFRRTSAAV